MTRQITLAALGLALLAPGTAAGEVALVRDGRPAAEIIVEPGAIASVKAAAGDLQAHIELMSGARLPIVEAPTPGIETRVFVGPGAYARECGVSVDDLKPEGFRIVARDNCLVLAGHDEQRPQFPFDRNQLQAWQEFAGEKYTIPFSYPINEELGFSIHDATGTFYAVSEFLEQLGVRWYHPYENGTVVPERKTIIVPAQDSTREPVFAVRHTNFYNTMLRDAPGVLWFKRLKYGSSYAVFVGHATGNIIGDPAQREENPGYYAVVDGKMINVPRLTDPGFRKSSLNFLAKMLEAYPYLKSVNLAPTDGFTTIDERDAAIWFRPEKGRRGRMSDYVWDYWLYAAAELKKTHPGIYLRYNSYEPYADPPSGVETLPDNVTICIAQNTATSFLPDNRWWVDQRAQWIPMLTSGKLFIYDYYLFYRNAQFPRYPVFFTKHLQEDMRSLKGVGEGKFVETSPEVGFYPGGRLRLTCPGLTHILHYWQGKLYWDPDMDREAMLEEYYRLYFGPAQAEMKEFYEFAEEVWMRPETRTLAMGRGFLKPADVDRYFEILARARGRAGAGTVHDARIAEIEAEMQPLKKSLAGMARTGPAVQAVSRPEHGTVLVDGDLGKPFWRGQSWWPWYNLIVPETGEVPAANRTSVSFRLTPDRSMLAIGVVCHETAMANLRARGTERDAGAILDDDMVEVYIETPERSYFRVAVNPNGAFRDETYDPGLVERDTLPELWNPGTRAAVTRGEDRWNVEIVIPTADFGALGPAAAYPWGINVCRTRRAGGGEPEFSALAPAGREESRVPVNWGNLTQR